MEGGSRRRQHVKPPWHSLPDTPTRLTRPTALPPLQGTVSGLQPHTASRSGLRARSPRARSPRARTSGTHTHARATCDVITPPADPGTARSFKELFFLWYPKYQVRARRPHHTPGALPLSSAPTTIATLHTAAASQQVLARRLCPTAAVGPDTAETHSPRVVVGQEVAQRVLDAGESG